MKIYPKYALIFLFGIMFGFVIFIARQNHQQQQLYQSLSTQSEVSRDYQKFHVAYDRPLRVEHLGSGEKYELLLTAQNMGKVNYFWHSLTQPKIMGQDVLYEKYEVVAETSKGRHITNNGSRLSLEINDLGMGWSASSQTSGWLYYNATSISLAYQP